MSSPLESLPLEGIVVIDLARMLPGPYASMILADLGAEVIRVEDPRYFYGSPPPFFQKGRRLFFKKVGIAKALLIL